MQLARAPRGPGAEDLPLTGAPAGPFLVRDSRETPAPGRDEVGRSERWLALAGSIIWWNVGVFWLVVFAMSVLGGSAFLFLWIAVLNILPVVRMRTRWLATLPLSHRVRLLAIVVPTLVVTTGCMAIGALIHRSTFYYGGGISNDAPMRIDDGYWSETTVSIDHWRRAPAGTAPVIVAPWGERVVADTATVFGVTLYNPWTTAKGSSPRFEQAQFERVTTELYGRPMTVEQYRASYPWPRRFDRGFRPWVVKGSFILTLGLVIMLILEAGYSHRIRPGSRGIVVAQWSCALLAMALLAADVMYRVRGGDVVFLLMRRGLVELGSRLPSNPVLAVLVAGIPVGVTYALLERQFRRSEPALVARAPSARDRASHRGG